MRQVIAVIGGIPEALVDALCEAFDHGDRPTPEYANRPPSLDDVVERRARAARSGALPAKGDAAADTAAARAHFRDNLRFYGPPTAGYADVLRLRLGIDSDRPIVCTTAVKRFVLPQAPLEEYIQWSG
ncbi:hypothetical protein [Streptomyces sp. NBC_01363]|uniref:hypothetical protein n=1 Tax=Streptomyces sp. NBC_01363 TaxID=2903840 RepID=UPI002252CB0C|nr:hypothetical protein [Streptomyces sp. NBC_01363]MCX4733901.1 hypothetical protein [Streptomyces sp. NBC_01363]